MLSINNITKKYGVEIILNSISFDINRGDRLALVGLNGCGKSTLMKILAGVEKPDEGHVRSTISSLRIGYLPQGFEFNDECTIGDCITFGQGDLDTIASKVERLAEALGSQPDSLEIQNAYDQAITSLGILSERVGQMNDALDALGLADLPPERLVSSLSGGQKTRLALSRALLCSPQLLLLDEPTNHLDLQMLEWLERWCSGFQGGLVVVSHDRMFLDRIATAILEIDHHTHQLRQYPGNYSAYLTQKEAEEEQQRQSYRDQQDEIWRLKRAAIQVRGLAKPRRGGKADTNDKFARGFFADRGMETTRRAKNLEKRIEQIMTRETIEKPRRTWRLTSDFGQVQHSGRDVLSLSNLSVGYGDNSLLSGLNLQVRLGDRIVIIGSNGIGKTTLLKTVVGKLAPLEGQYHLGTQVKIGYMSQEQEDLDPGLNALQIISRILSLDETRVRAFLSQFLFPGDDVFVPVRCLSYGERSRLSLACMVAAGCNLLLLDEPLNHLDIFSRESFEEAILRFEGTMIVVTHDRYFIDRIASEIWKIENQKIERIYR